MTPRRLEKTTGALAFSFGLFLVGSTFSIAVAQTALGLVLVLFLVVAIAQRHNPFVSSLRWFYYAVAGYLIWSILATLMGDNSLRGMAMLREEWLFMVVPVGIFLMRYERYRERLITSFGVAVLVISIYAILQHFLGMDWFRDQALLPAGDHGWRVRGTFTSRMTFGNYYGTAAMVLLGYGAVDGEGMRGRRRSFLLGSAALAMMAAILSYSRGVVAGLLLTLLLAAVVLGHRQGLAVLGILITGAIAIALTMPGLVGRFSDVIAKDADPDYEGGRLFIWSHSLEIVRENPVFGVGTGNFYEAYASHLPPDIPDFRKHTHAHNDLLSAAAIGGIPGLLSFVSIWVAALAYFWKGWRERRQQFRGRGRFFLAAGLGSTLFLITSFTEATFSDEEVRQLLMFVWAIGLCPWYKDHSTEQCS